MGMTQMMTTLNREYALRFLGVAVLFLGLSGWFLYDGLIGYPQKNAQVAPVAEALAQKNLPAIDWMNEVKTGTAPLVEAFRQAEVAVPSKLTDTFMSWIRADDPRAKDPAFAAAVLRKPLYSGEDIRTQFISAGIGVIASALLLCIVVWRFFTRFTLDETALTCRTLLGTGTYPLADLVSLDDSQWEKRGIFKATFRTAAVTLDAWHHAGIRPIVEALQAARKPTL